jgi:hypothetical protein
VAKLDPQIDLYLQLERCGRHATALLECRNPSAVPELTMLFKNGGVYNSFLRDIEPSALEDGHSRLSGTGK